MSSFKKPDKDSGLQSITSIYGDSSNDINPEENKGNQGMMQSHLNSVRKSGMVYFININIENVSNSMSSIKNSKLEQSLKNSIIKQKDVNISSSFKKQQSMYN